MVTFLIDRLLRYLQRGRGAFRAAGNLARAARRAWAPRGVVQESETDFGAGLLHHLREKRLRSSIKYAAAESPYYSELFDRGGIRTGEIRSIGDLSALPMTDNRELLEWRRFLSVPESEVAVTAVSAGTTGMPKTVAFSAADWNQICASRAAGIQAVIGKRRQAALLVLPSGAEMWADRRATVDALERLEFQTFEASVERVEEGVRWLVDFSPALMTGTPYALELLTACAADVGFAYRPSAILTFGDAPGARRIARLREYWQAPVVAAYGAAELGGAQTIAFPECRGTHLNELDFIFEVVDPDTGEPAHMGELVVTTLLRQAMPLVRYRTGDLARRLSHDCRLPFGNYEILDDGVSIAFNGLQIGARELSERFGGMSGLSGRFCWRYRGEEEGGGAVLEVERSGYLADAENSDEEVLGKVSGELRAVLPALLASSSDAGQIELLLAEQLHGQIRDVRIEDRR